MLGASEEINPKMGAAKLAAPIFGHGWLIKTRQRTRGLSMALVEKRARSPTGDNEGALIETKKPKSDALSVGAVPRTSTLHSPIMVLTGHGGEVRAEIPPPCARCRDSPPQRNCCHEAAGVYHCCALCCIHGLAAAAAA